MGVTKPTPRSWRKRGFGPPYIRFSTRKGVRYDPVEVEKWILGLPKIAGGYLPKREQLLKGKKP
jgi:hypothetical protein